MFIQSFFVNLQAAANTEPSQTTCVVFFPLRNTVLAKHRKDVFTVSTEQMTGRVVGQGHTIVFGGKTLKSGQNLKTIRINYN